MTLALTFYRWRIAFGGLATALLLTLVVGTPQGQAAAAAFLAQFRSQQLTVVTVGPQAQSALGELSRLGTLQGGDPGRTQAQAVKTVQEASRLVGFTVKQPDPATLPATIAATPQITVTPASELRFTFDKAKARAYYQSIGRPDVSLPDSFDGATLVVSMPAAVLLQYPATDTGPGLVVGQAGAPAAGVDGKVSLDEIRAFLLDLPGLPPETVQQLRAIPDWRTTLPIPVPTDQLSSQPTRVAGTQGILLKERSGLFSGVLWQQGDRVYGVGAGPGLSIDLTRVADGLR